MKPKNKFVENYRAQVSQLLANVQELVDLKTEYDTLALSSKLTDADCVGNDPDLAIKATEFVAAVGTVKVLTDIIFNASATAELAKLYTIKV
jgi:hypothetical protein